MRHLIYNLVQIFSSLFDRKNKLKYDLVIVKPDALGDFSIFSPFLHNLLTNVCADKKVLFVGNSACQNLASAFNFPNNLNFFWINRRKFNRNPIYRFLKVAAMQNINCEEIICPIYQDDQYVSDYVVNAICSRFKITMRLNEYDLSKITEREIYSKKFLSKTKYAFEVDLHKIFLSQIFKDKNLNDFDAAPINSIDVSTFDLPNVYYVVFIGASDYRRRWPINNYIELCKKLEKVYDGTPVFCGSIDDANKISQTYLNELKNSINIIGKTSMAQLVNIISKADYLISNESCAPHIAYISGCKKSYVISNGNHLGRFCPYPSKLYSGYSLLLPPEITYKVSDSKLRNDLYFNECAGNIENISVENVFNKISESFK